MKRIRKGAPSVPRDQRSYVRLDRVGGGTFAQLWFLTQGCTWDRAGACTMCNYGHGASVADEAMVESVRIALATIHEPVDELFVSPSGSMLDPREVPPGARLGIYECMASADAPRLCIETRPETVTHETAEQLMRELGSKQVAVEMGLESSSPWVQRWCINRVSEPDEFARAAGLLRRRGLQVYANASLGAAFLSPSEAIADAVSSVEWALAHGADLVVLFPLHVKSHTLLEWLHRRGSYHPPSLWSLGEVLARLEPENLSRVNISWYRSDYGSSKDVLLSPATCPRCQPRILGLLDRFRAEPTPAALAELTDQECECREAWWRDVRATPKAPLAERVLAQYETLVAEFGLAEWWGARRASIRSDVLAGPIGRE